MTKLAPRAGVTTVLTVSAILSLVALGYAQSVTGVEVQSSHQPSTDDVSTPLVLGRLSILGKGQQTTSDGACTDAACPSSDLCVCVSWTGLVLTGGFNGTPFKAPTLTGDFTADTTHITTSGSGTGGCLPGAGPSTVFTNAAKTGSIKVYLIGQLCTLDVTNPTLQFAGSYLVTGGTGVYSSAAGSGTVTADVNNDFTTSIHTVQMNGTLLR